MNLFLRPLTLLVFTFIPVFVFSQVQPNTTSLTRPRTVTKQPIPSSSTVPNQAKPSPSPMVQTNRPMSQNPSVQSNTQANVNLAPTASTVNAIPAFPSIVHPAKTLSVDKVRTRLTEALRLVKDRPVATSLTTTPSLYTVTVTALDPEHSKIHLISIPKTTFLSKETDTVTSTSAGTPIRFRIVRSNYVNTAIQITDLKGHQFLPLIVAYPIEKYGSFKEMAYYTSAHPALISTDLIKYGQSYVRSMVDLAAKRLKEKGINIPAAIADMAEKLCIVEHIDHDRFLTENRLSLFQEVFSLYGLNELNTYRYSVSSAGAGGMVQMIAPTYRFIRERYPQVGLHPDFVTGMRNHENALQAMLLYIRDTWNDLASNMEVNYALGSGIATQAELIAAGYNSNPARLPLYLRRGGSSWRSLIPRETQMYLQILQSLNSNVPTRSRAESNVAQYQSSQAAKEKAED
jgi:hypothetical protein